ncbi:MAG TPA: bifunctional hydroxymethylpyrimidine kinase/phosphomethylpyrimidine kinase [Verrucomicrobiae bacterium]|nr:bifunctional hydroxymethylpyrimidine kinase/phosphomethylpyrimidine kinase [Verrucomicrobiae bacterium]
MIARNKTPVALTIAGSDSGGGAGIQADLKTFAALGVHGASAIACLTAQNPERVMGIEPVSPKMLDQQIGAVFDELPPKAVKTGMLFSTENARVVASFFSALPARQRVPLIVDPVLISTSRAALMAPGALNILKERLLPIATLVTPNIGEAEILSGRKISAIDEMREAAQGIQARFGCAVLLKGGHLKGTGRATDLFFDGKNNFFVSVPFVAGLRTHGTGCVYSAAICAALALGQNLPQAVRTGKKFITAAIRRSYRIGGHFALGI